MVGEIEKSPLLGYGAEHIDYLFNRFYDPSVISEEWFDRSHNAYLDYAAQYGLGGVALYGALIILFGWTALSLARKNRAYTPLVYGALVYGVQNFFVFDTVTVWWLVLALTAALLAADQYPGSAEQLAGGDDHRRKKWAAAFRNPGTGGIVPSAPG